MKIYTNKLKNFGILGILVLTLTIIAPSPKTTEAQAAYCPLNQTNSNDIIVYGVEEKLVARDVNGYNTYKITGTGYSIPAGKYNITVATYDNHSEQGLTNLDQFKESVFLRLYNSSGSQMLKTGNTNDIPWNKDYQTTLVSSNVTIPNTITTITAEHAYHNNSNTPESVAAVCAKFERIEDPEPPQPEPLSASCSVSDTRISVGESVTFTANADGGTSPYSYNWSGAISGNSRQITKTFNSAGTYNVSVTVSDAQGKSDKDNCSTVIVEDNPEPTNPQVQCKVSATRISVGDSVTFSSSVTGGESPYSYDWNGSVNSSASQTSRTFNSAGSYTASITVIDANNKSDTDNCPTIIVEEDPQPETLNVICRVSDTRVEEGDRVYFEAIVSGGNSPYTYDWEGDVGGNSREVSEIFDREGRYYASVEVRDQDGNRDTANCDTVYVEEEDEDDFDVQCKISDTTIEEGDRITIEVDIDGGNRPYDIKWSGDDNEIDDFDDEDESQRVRIDDAGRYYLEVTVRDDDGNRASDNCPVIRVEDEDDDRDITVITDDTSGHIASISSVYLNQIPYTGPEDNLKIFGFIALVLIWSSLVAYYALRKRNKKLFSKKIDQFKQDNLAKKLG